MLNSFIQEILTERIQIKKILNQQLEINIALRNEIAVLKKLVKEQRGTK